jgi:DNA-directed RNA polymerase subunit M/transcription elongation factor TFIIS
MRATKNGLVCSKCGHTVQAEVAEITTIELHAPSPIDVIDESEHEHPRVSEKCPNCGNSEAFRSVSFISGEHAGVRQERSMERFTCTKCGHSWTRD